MYGGVQSLFVKFSRTKNIKFVKTFQYLEKKLGKYGRSKNCAKKMSKIWEESSPIRMTLITYQVLLCLAQVENRCNWF